MSAVGSSNLTKREWVWIGMLAAAVVAIYFEVYSIPFLYSEKIAVLRHPAASSLSGFFERMLTVKGLFQKPLSIFTYALNHSLGGPEPAGFHAVNLVIHLVNCFLLYLIARPLMRFPIVAAAFFALHPLATATVSRIYGRNYSLGTLFLLAGVWAFQKYQAQNRLKEWKVQAAVGALFAAMLLSKQSFVFFPVLLLWWGLARDEGSWRASLAELYSKHFNVIVVAATLSLLFVATYAIPYSQTASVSPLQFLLSQFGNWPEIVQIFTLPTHLAVYHELPMNHSLLDLRVLSGMAIVGALIVATVRWRTDAKALFLGAFLIWLAPTNSVMPKNEILYEWRLYPSLPFLALLVGACASQLAIAFRPMRSVVFASAVVYFSIFGAIVAQQNRVYQSERGAWLRALELYPHSEKAMINVGTSLAREEKYVEALGYFQKVLAQNPSHERVMHNIALAYKKLGNEPQAKIYEERLNNRLRARGVFTHGR